jgi:hypothetical protein
MMYTIAIVDALPATGLRRRVCIAGSAAAMVRSHQE